MRCFFRNLCIDVRTNVRNKFSNIILGLFLVFLTGVSGNAIAAQKLQPAIAISPPRLEMHPESGKASESITVLNMSSNPMQLKVAVNNWDLDLDNKFRALAPTEQSLDQWLIINPVRLTIPANSQQTVRLAIRPRAKPEAGEHRAMIFFKQLPDPTKKGQINFNVGVPVYAYYGDVKRTAEVHSIDFNSSEMEFIFDVTNTGNSYVRPEGHYLVMSSENAGGDEELFDLLSESAKKKRYKRNA